MLENKYKTHLIKKIKKMFPGCLVLHLDPTEIQGIPDLLILHQEQWASLEVKKSATASHRPNQDWYVNKMMDMSYSAFIYPENEEEILNDIQRTWSVQRQT